jgi:hypothetical protein
VHGLLELGGVVARQAAGAGDVAHDRVRIWSSDGEMDPVDGASDVRSIACGLRELPFALRNAGGPQTEQVGGT